MPHSALQAAPYKKSLYATLSAILLLSTVSCVSTTSISPKNTTLKTADYCLSSNKVESQAQAADDKTQSVQQRAINCMLNELQTYQQKNMSARQQYFAYKAQAWLNYATDKDRSRPKAMVSGFTGPSAAEN